MPVQLGLLPQHSIRRWPRASDTRLPARLLRASTCTRIETAITMNSIALQDSWQKCWHSIAARGDGLSLMQRLVCAYQEPQRRYHTFQHLGECLALFDAHADLAHEPGEVGIALWFHDAIYDVHADDNEARSAEWAATELAAACVAPARIARITQHILATRHAALPQGQDQMLLVDIDLAILGAPRPRFMEYEAQIRAEYSWVPDAVFREKRSALLRTLLAREPLYNTPRLQASFELQARSNLQHSLQLLGVHRKAAGTRYGPCR